MIKRISATLLIIAMLAVVSAISPVMAIATTLTDDFEKAIEKINNDKPIGAAIYTDEAELGYKFINRIHSKNVFVNTSFAELDTKIEDPANVLYMMKKIMYPN